MCTKRCKRLPKKTEMSPQFSAFVVRVFTFAILANGCAAFDVDNAIPVSKDTISNEVFLDNDGFDINLSVIVDNETPNNNVVEPIDLLANNEKFNLETVNSSLINFEDQTKIDKREIGKTRPNCLYYTRRKTCFNPPKEDEIKTTKRSTVSVGTVTTISPEVDKTKNANKAPNWYEVADNSKETTDSITYLEPIFPSTPDGGNVLDENEKSTKKSPNVVMIEKADNSTTPLTISFYFVIIIAVVVCLFGRSSAYF